MRTPEYCLWLDALARDAHDAINRIHVEAYADLVRTAELYAGELACRRPHRGVRLADPRPGR